MAADRKRVGGLNTSKLDPAVARWQQNAATNPATVSKKQRRDRDRVRIYVDVDETLKAALEALAGWEREDSSMSQVAEMLIAFGLREYIRDNTELQAAFQTGKTHARTPRFTWNLEIPESWATEIERFSANGNIGGKNDGQV